MPTQVLTASTNVKTSSGKVKNFSVIVAGTAAGSINDANSVPNANAANAYIGLPANVGAGSFGPAGWNFINGITVLVGTGQTISIDYE